MDIRTELRICLHIWAAGSCVVTGSKLMALVGAATCSAIWLWCEYRACRTRMAVAEVSEAIRSGRVVVVGHHDRVVRTDSPE